ncbi:MerR family DNA-binding transcriptional regulator [Oceanirhabdus seepicola]|uniref:MerR family DNA-binding transcriptional regulator n=1 Tax=Oceanirhabdus seepicola TaxID=2828781 RepID=A0A9J6NVR1_9CLOT|nr:MerR family DNA-binding transcriptional regulator [Oceanirhabdus seepicola]MCM1988339.1 MerR family DNA-binding transcriptional regulator [Oceanirhabdus seepicola]
MEYTIGKAARIVGLTAYTLRYCEKEGLLPQIDYVIESLEKYGMTVLSETQDLTLDISMKILETAM